MKWPLRLTRPHLENRFIQVLHTAADRGKHKTLDRTATGGDTVKALQGTTRDVPEA